MGGLKEFEAFTDQNDIKTTYYEDQNSLEISDKLQDYSISITLRFSDCSLSKILFRESNFFKDKLPMNFLRSVCDQFNRKFVIEERNHLKFCWNHEAIYSEELSPENIFFEISKAVMEFILFANLAKKEYKNQRRIFEENKERMRNQERDENRRKAILKETYEEKKNNSHETAINIYKKIPKAVIVNEVNFTSYFNNAILPLNFKEYTAIISHKEGFCFIIKFMHFYDKEIKNNQEKGSCIQYSTETDIKSLKEFIDSLFKAQFQFFGLIAQYLPPQTHVNNIITTRASQNNYPED